MEYRSLHPWEVSAREAIRIQQRLRTEVRVEPLARAPRLVAGADISYNRYSDVLYAGFVVLDVATLQVVARSTVVQRATFPYVSGLLSFREAPPLLEAWRKLDVDPDVVMFDGQGLAHPRRLGIACHMGLLIDRPTLGCAKTLLVGRYTDLAPEAGAMAPLIDHGEQVGVALRTRRAVTPVYISVGHRLDLATAAALALRCTLKVRLPEPTRQAHLLVNELRRQAGGA